MFQQFPSDSVETFITVSKLKSFSAAADQLKVSKAFVSIKIKKLEDHLGTRLLHRTTRSLSLTESGQIFFKDCEHVMEAYREAENRIRNIQDSFTGRLKVAAPNMLGERYVLPVLNEFSALHPDLNIEFNLYSRLINPFEEDYDLTMQISKPKILDTIATPISSTRFLVCAHPDYLEQHGKPKRPADLEKHATLFFTDHGKSKPWRLNNGKQEVLVNPARRMESNSGQVLLAAAREARGIAYLPDYYIRDDLKEGRLVPLFKNWCQTERPIYAVYCERHYISVKVRAFIDLLKLRFEELPSAQKL